MEFVLQLVTWCAGLPLTLLVIAAMRRGAFRNYPVLFLFEIAGFLLTVAGMPLYIQHFRRLDHASLVSMAKWNVWNDAILTPLEYAVVISLIYVAASHVRSRRTVLTATIGGACLIAGVSFLLHFNPKAPNGVWMALWTRDLNFFSEIMDLGLWGLLVSTRGRDSRLLLVTGGLGIQFTGDAIGDSLRSLAAQRHSHLISFTGSFFSTVVDLTALYVIWQAFRRSKKEPGNGSPAARAPSSRYSGQ